MEKKNFISDLHLACRKDEINPILECIYFLNGYAYATDSYVMIKQSLEYSNLNGELEHLDCKAIHMDSFKEIRKHQFVEVTEDGFDCTAKNGRKAFYPFKTFDSNVEIPDFDAAIPNGITQVDQLGICPRHIAVLEKGMAGGGFLTMAFSGVGSSIVLHSVDENYQNQLALVMPKPFDDE